MLYRRLQLEIIAPIYVGNQTQFSHRCGFDRRNDPVTYETDVYQITCGEEDTADELFCPLAARAGRLALLFGISRLPPDCRICIDILGRKSFEREKGLYFGKSAGPEIVAFSTERVRAVSYRAVQSRYTPEGYRQVILHEFVHVLQWISTRVPPKQNVWLYEAVACFLAGQTADVSHMGDAVPWDTFRQDFYAAPRCYGIAYHLGAALLSGCAPGEAVARCSDVPHCEAVCAEAYAGLFK